MVDRHSAHKFLPQLIHCVEKLMAFDTAYSNYHKYAAYHATYNHLWQGRFYQVWFASHIAETQRPVKKHASVRLHRLARPIAQRAWPLDKNTDWQIQTRNPEF